MELFVNNEEFFSDGNEVKVVVNCFHVGLSSIEIYECSSIFDTFKTTWEYLERYPGGRVAWKIYKDKFLREMVSFVEGITKGTAIKMVF